eukprot:Tamp_15580.p1 GENE.Tamp_15580~~Tamp_15580.p1  ORF type:complete len:444 (+),score=57.59 Tamp_15580:2-1333(+)
MFAGPNTRWLSGRCPLLADFARQRVEEYWGRELSDIKWRHLELVHQTYQDMSRRNVAQFFLPPKEPASVHGFGKIVVMDPLEWSNGWVACSERLGALQRVPRQAIRYSKARIFEIFQYTGVRSHGTAGRAGFFRDAFDRGHRATFTYSLQCRGQFDDLTPLRDDRHKHNLDSCVWKFKLEAFNSQKHRATTEGNGNQDRKKNKRGQMDKKKPVRTPSSAGGTNIDPPPPPLPLPPPTSAAGTQAHHAAGTQVRAGGIRVKLCANVPLGSKRDQAMAELSLPDDAAGHAAYKMSKADVKEALLSVQDSLHSADASGSQDATMFDLSQSDSAANPQTESQQLDEDAAEHLESQMGSQALSEPGPWEMEEVTDEELFEKTESAANPQTESQQLDEDAAEHFGQADESQAGSQALSEPGPWEMEEVTDTESCSTRPRRGSAFLMPLA